MIKSTFIAIACAVNAQNGGESKEESIVINGKNNN